MPEQDETNRIRRVYDVYERDHLRQTKWSLNNPGNQAILRERRQATATLLRAAGITSLESSVILEVGCGRGNILSDLVLQGAVPANYHGIDLLENRVFEAQRAWPGSDFRVGNAQKLPFGERTVDFVVAFTLFSSILDRDVAQAVAAEIHRVLRDRGWVLWYDLRRNNPANRNVRGIRRSEIRELFPHYHSSCRSLTMLPPLARRLGALTRLLYPVLAYFPPLRTHFLALLGKAEG